MLLLKHLVFGELNKSYSKTDKLTITNGSFFEKVEQGLRLVCWHLLILTFMLYIEFSCGGEDFGKLSILGMVLLEPYQK